MTEDTGNKIWFCWGKKDAFGGKDRWMQGFGRNLMNL